MPAFGLGTLATTSRPFSIVMRKALLNMPSGYFLMETHRVAPTESAATLASMFKSNLTSRRRRFSASSTMKRPRVNLKKSSFEFQSGYGMSDSLKDHVGMYTGLAVKTPCWRDRDRRITLDTLRLSGSVASGLRLYFYFE